MSLPNISLPDFSSMHFLVIGDVMLDIYIKGDVNRISPEAPVPVLLEKKREYRPGGAANVAMNLAGLGAKVSLIGYVGNDEEANQLVSQLKQNTNIQFFPQTHTGIHTTICKTRLVAKGQQMLRIDRESKAFDLMPDKEMLELIKELGAKSQAVLISDYNKGCIHPEIFDTLSKIPKRPFKIWVDPKRKTWDDFYQADWITPNFSEFRDFMQILLPSKMQNENRSIEESLQNYFSRFDNKIPNILITRSEKGLTAATNFNPDNMHFDILHEPSTAREVFDVSGAGDTVLAVMAACTSAKMPLRNALIWANHAAGLVISRQGTVPVTREWMLQDIS